MGLTLTIPENSAPKDSYITIIPLTKEELVNIPSDVYNVTYTENGITYIGYDVRLNGSSTNKFKKNIEISFKYNDSAYKDKSIENAVFIYYFDEENYKWEKISRKGLDKGRKEVKSHIDHFCQFYAGLMSMQTEPPQAKGINTKPINIEAVDPLVGYRNVEPPKASNYGSANIKYPIVIPEGINGLTPDIKLFYSSENREGDCGYGWNLNTSKIELKTKNVGKINYDITDTLILDGDELVMLNNDTVNKRVTYRRKVEKDFCKIVKNTDSTDTANYNSIIVYKADGTRYYYGLDANSRSYNTTKASYANQIFTWYLSKIEDKFENFIYYTYEKLDANRPYLKSIKYSYSCIEGISTYLNNINNDSNLYIINFNWINRTSGTENISYLSGFSYWDVTDLGIINNKKLDSISINYKTGSNLYELKKYKLTYGVGAFEKEILLNIQENILNDSSYITINETIFEYNTDDTPDFESNYMLIPVNGVTYPHIQEGLKFDAKSFVDLNQDGYTELFFNSINGNGQYLSINYFTDAYFYIPGNNTFNPNTSYRLTKPVKTNSDGEIENYTAKANIFDFNNDHMPDILYLNYGETNSTGKNTYLNYNKGKALLNYGLTYDIPDNEYLYFCDANGDGYADMLTGDSSNGYYINWRTPTDTQKLFTPGPDITGNLVDINGDGLPDMLGDNGISWNNHGSFLNPAMNNGAITSNYFIDINGDGLQTTKAFYWA